MACTLLYRPKEMRMKNSFYDLTRSIIKSTLFTPFISGVPVVLPTGEKILIKIKNPQRSYKSTFLHSKYYYFTKVTGGGFNEVGHAEGDCQLITIQKSISEAVERILYRCLKGTEHGTLTSNGWATHLNRQSAKKAALAELLERDAALVHWLCKRPLLEIANEDTPQWLRLWADENLKNSEFPQLHVFMSQLGHVPTISTMLMNNQGHGVISHCADASLEKAIYRALAETCRLARMATSRRYVDSSLALTTLTEDTDTILGPIEHAVAFAHHLTFPEWIFGENISMRDASEKWNLHLRQYALNPITYSFKEVLTSPLSSGYCSSPDVQNLFFGKTTNAKKAKYLNVGRLKNISLSGSINLIPHFVA